MIDIERLALVGEQDGPVPRNKLANYSVVTCFEEVEEGWEEGVAR